MKIFVGQLKIVHLKFELFADTNFNEQPLLIEIPRIVNSLWNVIKNTLIS